MKEMSCGGVSNAAHAFVALIPHEFDCEIATEWRKNEIAAAKSLKVKREKAFAWALLEYAVKKVFDKDIEEFSPKKDENGKIIADGIFTSISHSGNYALAVVANTEVGGDIEEKKDKDFTRLVEKIATESEKTLFSAAKDKKTCFFKLWTAKEALYKRSGEKVFSPEKTPIDGKAEFFVTENFVAAVAFDGETRFKFLRYENGKFSE